MAKSCHIEKIAITCPRSRMKRLNDVTVSLISVRQGWILNKKAAELNLVFSIEVNDFNYAVFVNSGTLKCFGCGREGHLVRTCPEKNPGSELSLRR